MKHLITTLFLILGLWALTPTLTADAMSSSKWQSRHQASGQGGTARSVPELDGKAAGGALVLLIGGIVYLASRRKDRRDENV
jgi:hypothetical protein